MIHIRLLSLAKKKHYYYKLITYTLIVSLLPLFFISFLFYHNTEETMQREMQKANTNYLMQTVNAMEIVTNQINNSFRQLSLDKVIREFEIFPQGSYLEGLSGSLAEDDQPKIYHYLDTKQRLFAILSVLKQSNQFINSVYFYDDSKQLVITADGMQYQPEQFYDKGWDKFTETFTSFPVFMDLRSATQRDGTVKDVLPFVYMSPIQGNYLVVNMDADSLYTSFVSKLDNKLDSAFVVLSASGNMLLYDASNALNERIGMDPKMKEQLGKSGGPAFESEYDGRRMLVTSIRSDALGWTFVTATALDDLYRSISNIKGIVLLTSFLLVVATGLLALLTTRNIYRPILHLIQYIKNKDQNFHDPETKYRDYNELNMIRGSLEGAYEDRSSLQVRLKESVPANQEKFVRSLLRPHSYDKAAIAERLRYLGLSVELEGLMLMLLSLEESYGTADGVESEDINKLHIIDIAENEIPGERHRIVMELGEGKFIVLINCSPHDFHEYFGVAEQIIRCVRERLGLTCSIGIGTYCDDIGDLQRAYGEAEEALRYRSIAGPCKVMYIDDFRLEGTPLFVYPKEKETALVTYIVNGETEQARSVLAEMMKDFRDQQVKVHYRQMQHAFVRLLGGFVAAANDLRLDLDSVMQTKSNLYSVLLQKNDLNETAAWFDEMIVKLSSQIDHAFQEKNNRHIEQVMRILESDYGQNMSLTVAADRLGLNPSYLSRIFKGKNGESFSECLTRIRIEQSKRLLLETSLKIKDIGERIGYNKTTYYSKLFKEFTGITPGEYRKMHAGDGEGETF